MITKMQVERFRAISDVTVRLGSFNVLIGPNDQGKTSFLEAVYALAATTRNPIAESFWSPWRGRNLVHRGDSKGIRLSASLGGADCPEGSLDYSLTVRPQGDTCTIAQETVGPNGPVLLMQNGADTMVRHHLRGASINPDLLPLVEAVASQLPSPALTRWDIEELGSSSMLPPDRKQAFDPTGYGLGTCLAEQKLASDETFTRISSRFLRLFPEFRGLGFRRVAGQYWGRRPDKSRAYANGGDCYEMIFQRCDGTDVAANLVSGGVLVTLAFLTIAELNGDLLLIEEPENGLHPARLQGIVETLREACASRPGSQVILTTHSPLLLDYVQPEEVRLFARNKAGEVEVHHLEDVPDIKDRLKYVMLGELVFGNWDDFVEEIREHANSGAR
jgi:energy-coupling factor transporter ATP-binding protein EcfA2